MFFSGHCVVEVKGLRVCLQPKHQFASDFSSMTDSLYKSYRNMTTSMQLAQESYKEKPPEESSSGNLFEGLDILAQTIERIISRIQIRLVNTTIRVEHVVEQLGVALELHISEIKYFDELSDFNQETTPGSQSPKADKQFYGFTMASKCFTVSGISGTLGQFSPDEPHSSFGYASKESGVDRAPEATMPPASKILQFSGQQEVKIRMEQQKPSLGAKIDVECSFDACYVFLTPNQVFLLIQLLTGFVSAKDDEQHRQNDFAPGNFASLLQDGGKPMTQADYTAMEKALFSNNGAQSLLDDDLFYSLSPTTSVLSKRQPRTSRGDRIGSAESDNFSCVTDHLPNGPSPLNRGPVSKLMGGKRAGDTARLTFSPGLHKMTQSAQSDHEAQQAVNFVSTVQCVLKWNCVVVTLLHVDPLFGDGQWCANTHAAGESAETEPAAQSLSVLKDLAEKHFQMLGDRLGTRPVPEVLKKRTQISEACSKHDHLRLIAGPVRLEYVLKSGSDATSTDVVTSISNLELLECLCQARHKKADCGQTARSDWTHSDLLSLCKSSKESSHSIAVIVKLHQRADKKSVKTSLDVQLPDCRSEVDISIVDRLALLTKLVQSVGEGQHFPSSVASSYSPFHLNKSGKAAMFQQVLQDHDSVKTELDFSIGISHLKVDFCFPIPDFRPEIEKNPWFARSLREERLFVNLKNCSFSTKSASGGIALAPGSSCSRQLCFKMSQMQVLFADKKNEPAKLFFEVGPDWIEANPSFSSDMQAARILITLNDEASEYSLGRPEFSVDMSETLSPDGLQAALQELEQSTLDDDWVRGPTAKSPTPFSSRKLVYDNENIVMPGTAKELQTFAEHAMATSRIAIEINFPSVVLHLPSKSFFENLYNRIANDLILWQPSAPYQAASGMERSSVYQCPKLDLASQFPQHCFQITEAERSSRFMFQSSARTEDALFDSDSSDDSTPNFFSVKSRAPAPPTSQSYLSLSVNLEKATVSVCCGLKDNYGKRSHLLLAINNGNFFTVTQYHGNENLDYACLQVKCFSLYSKCNSDPTPKFKDIRKDDVAHGMQLLVERTSQAAADDLCARSSDDNCMLTIAIKMESNGERGTKRYLISSLVCDATLHHRFAAPSEAWVEQIVDFIDVKDDDIAGYVPPHVITEMHTHAQDCFLYYRPRYLTPNLHCLVSLQSFSLSSNVITGAPTSVMRMIVDNAALYVSDRPEVRASNPTDFVRVVDIGFLEVRVNLSNETQDPDAGKDNPRTVPAIDLTVRNNGVHVHTCVDSCAALARLLKYLSRDGDLNGPTEHVIARDVVDTQSETMSESSDSEYEDTVSDLIMDAMKDDVADNPLSSSVPPPSPSDSHHFQATEDPSDVPEHENTKNPAPKKDHDPEDDFCFIVDPDLEDCASDTDPEVVYYRPSYNIKIVEEHFCRVFEKSDQLRAPADFPIPLIKYTIEELTCTWSLYGGSDFGQQNGAATSKSPKASPLHRAHNDSGNQEANRSRLGRDTTKLVEMQLSKMRFRHEAYDPGDHVTARTVLVVNDLEVRDRLESSQINKFLYCFHSESSPKQSHANMLLIKALLTKPERPSTDRECRLRVSLQPLRLNVDQDTLEFLTSFFASLASLSNDDMTGSSRPPPSSPRRDVPRKSRLGTDAGRGTDENVSSSTSAAKDELPDDEEIFFRDFVFSPEVPIRLDYHGKHIDIEQGTIAGLLMGLGQLNCSQLKLRKIVHRHGLLGVDRVINFALNEWADDIRRNQLPSILGGVGPLHSVVQFFQGVHDLVWLPVEQYKKDGRIIRGLQKGTSAFGTSTTMATLELINRMVCLVQSAAETAYDVVSPADRMKRLPRDWRALEIHAKKKRQPADLREGVNNALNVVRDGVADTAVSIARAAQEEHEQKGLTGAVGGVLRHIPPTLVRPVIIASEATSNILSGVRNQILPDAKREEEHKYRSKYVT